MVLSVHILVGGALGKALNTSPAASFFVGMASHFALDAIPHADYPLKSLQKNRENRGNDSMHKDWRLAHDLVVNGLDGILGFLVLLFLTYQSSNLLPVIAGAIGACVPDGLQFLHFLFPDVKFLAWFKKFHSYFHIPEKIEVFMESHKLLAFSVQALIGISAIYSMIHLAFARF
jgi:hypothetical protein